ncbi:MAG: hypothetical protein F4Y08_16230 [Caldilineaceae bacterium SB0662_bin_9]|uniref:ApeA N-terminal domain-containing protein n=1 Tax=Caldilineaceae bacterium SB0662_bin_9 TaxID=2605258 RepID=A0A6B1DWV6_9CHLR|nr:hypothetical protein [Caldilineaceae bacterium SB0662_bin_9]
MRLDAFSDSGYFWLPGGEDQSLQVPGNLSVSEAGRVTLETFGYWSEDPLSLAHDVQPSKLTRIFGYTPERGEVTLTDAAATRISIPSRRRGWVFNRSSFEAGKLLIGGHFGENEQLFDRLTCRIEGLHEWLGVSGFTIERDSPTCTTVTYHENPPPLQFQVSDDVNGEFGLGHSISFQAPAGIKAPEARYSAYVKLSTSMSWTEDDVLHWALCMRDFISLGTGNPVAITGLEGWKPADEQEDANTDYRENRVEIFCASKQQSLKSNANHFPQFMTFTYKDIDISHSIKKWVDLCFDGRSTGGQAVELFCDVLYGDGILPDDIRLFKAAEALKLMYLSMMDDEDGDCYLAEAVKCLASKFSELLWLDGGETEFAERVRATRNLWVHRKSDPGGTQACEGVDLFRLLRQCEALLFCCLTAHALGSEGETIRVLRNARPIKDRVRSA